MSFEKIFVTVGTTEFNELIEELSKPEVLQILKDHLKCKKLVIQIGRGKQAKIDFEGINVEQYDLKTSIESDILEADLILSHAGAGTCIDVLRNKKPLVVVVNDTLMHNHQIELAQQLHKDGYLFYTFTKNLAETLKTLDVTELKPYEKGNIKEFLKYLDDFIGFL